MTLKTAMLTDYYSVSADTQVADALAFLYENNIRKAPVIDKEGKYLGLFCFRRLLGKLLPAGMLLDQDLETLNFTSRSDTDIQEKFDVVVQLPVREVMETDRPVLSPDMSFWHTLLMIYEYDAPLAVVDPETQKVLGVVTKQSALDDLKRRLPNKK